MNRQADNKGKAKGRNSEPQISGWRWFATKLFGLIRQFGSQLIWAVVLIYLTRTLGLTISAFAGRASFANFIVNVAAHVNLTIAISVVLTGITSLMWFREYRRHCATRERLTARITQLEKKIDPNRQTSNLTTKGTTRNGDL